MTNALSVLADMLSVWRQSPTEIWYAKHLPAESGRKPNLRTRTSGNARRTTPCGRRSSLISVSFRTEDTFRLFPDAGEAMILAFGSRQPWP